MKKRNLSILVLVVLVFILGSCANVSPHAEICVTSSPYGFFGGLWHGIILPFSWIGSLFSDNIAIYAFDNNGGWYDTGFLFGCGTTIFSSSKSSK